jgi:hypothetical protein
MQRIHSKPLHVSDPILLASQLGISSAALVAIKVGHFWFQSSLIVAMLAQVFWRGFVITIGT